MVAVSSTCYFTLAFLGIFIIAFLPARDFCHLITLLSQIKGFALFQVPRSGVSLQKDGKRNQFQIHEEWLLLSGLVTEKLSLTESW